MQLLCKATSLKESIGAGVDWTNGRFVASRVWRGNVQYKREGEGPLLRLYKTEVAKVPTPSPHPSLVLSGHAASLTPY